MDRRAGGGAPWLTVAGGRGGAPHTELFIAFAWAAKTYWSSCCCWGVKCPSGVPTTARVTDVCPVAPAWEAFAAEPVCELLAESGA